MTPEERAAAEIKKYDINHAEPHADLGEDSAATLAMREQIASGVNSQRAAWIAANNAAAEETRRKYGTV